MSAATSAADCGDTCDVPMSATGEAPEPAGGVSQRAPAGSGTAGTERLWRRNARQESIQNAVRTRARTSASARAGAAQAAKRRRGRVAGSLADARPRGARPASALMVPAARGPEARRRLDEPLPR